MLHEFKKITPKAIAGFMALWLSGFIFLFCCETLNAKSMSMDSCPLAKMSEHCDRAKKASDGSARVGSPDGNSVDCCGFLPVVFDKSRKVEQAQKRIATTPEVIAVKFAFPSPAGIPPAIASFESRVPNRHGTFIKNCVLRI